MEKEMDLGSLFKSLKIPDKILVSVLMGLAAGEDLLESLPTPRSVTRSLYTTQPEFRGIPKYSFRAALVRLTESKYLEKVDTEAENRYRITQEGVAHLYQKFPQLKLSQKRFDGSFRIVIYDIFESERNLRRELRHGLKKMGFVYLQRSVWLSPYNWDEELDQLFKKLGAGDDILIFKSTLPNDRTKNLLKAHWPNLLRSV